MDPLSTSTAPLPTRHPCLDPSPPYSPHGSLTCQLVQLGARCTHTALTHSSHRHPTLVGPPKYQRGPSNLLIALPGPGASYSLAGPAWSLPVNTHTPPTHTQFGGDTDTCPHQPAPGTWAVTCGPTPASVAEPLTCLTHPGPPSSWFWEHTLFPPQWLEVTDLLQLICHQPCFISFSIYSSFVPPCSPFPCTLPHQFAHSYQPPGNILDPQVCNLICCSVS